MEDSGQRADKYASSIAAFARRDPYRAERKAPTEEDSMSDQAIIDAGLQDAEGSIIEAPIASLIASHWHGGQSSALYALASTGTVTEDAAAEVQHELDILPTGSDELRLELLALLDYIIQAS